MAVFQSYWKNPFVLVCCMTNLSSVRQHCMVVSKVACNVLVK